MRFDPVLNGWGTTVPRGIIWVLNCKNNLKNCHYHDPKQQIGEFLPDFFDKLIYPAGIMVSICETLRTVPTNNFKK